nr:hypothetical protein [Tanacetum cinerariifolium]
FQASGPGADEGTGTIPGVLDVPTDESEEEISWKSTDEEGDDDEGNDGDDDDEGNDGDDGEEGDDDDDDDEQDDDDQEDEGDDDEDDQEEGSDDEQGSDEEAFIHPSLSTHAEEEQETRKVLIPSRKHLKTLMMKAIVKKIFKQMLRMNKAVKVAVQIQSDRLRDEAQAEYDEFLNTIDENMQKIIKEQVKEQVKVKVSKILPNIEQTMNEQLEAEKMEGNKSIHRSNEQRNLYKSLVEAYESDKIILDTYRDTVTLKRRHDDTDKDEEPSAGSDRGSKRRREGKEPESASAPKEKATRSAGADDQPIVEPSQHPKWFSQQKKPPTLDHDWNKTLPATHGSIQPWISELAKQSDSRSSFNELMDTPVDFSNFLMNRLKVDTLTLELLVGPTYELMKGSCKSLVELEFFLEKVYNATTDQLNWVNSEGQQYLHNLHKPLPLIPNSRGHRVIPFNHFINNDLQYLRGGASSRKYTTYVTKTKVAGYRYIKWIEDLFYGFAVNRESARDVYPKRRIIAVTKLKIVEWHNYKHLDWITVRRDDDKLYKFKEGDFKRLRIQDIEDIIVIQRRMEDLQLGVESYQKELNLTRLDTYCSDLKRKEAYSAYSNPRGFIYQNKDKQNRLMRIDELHKFSDGTLTDVRTALDDHLKGIRIKYLPKSI